MRTASMLIKRNVKLFFLDRGMFFTALITPLILLVLYVSFLGNIYRDSFLLNLPEGFVISEKILSGLVGGQLVSSMLSVSCVTVAFCSNFLMVQDRANGTLSDLSVSPIGPYVLSFSYYAASLISTLIISFTATALCLIYLSIVGWYLSFVDVILLILDIILLVLFGTALSSVINFYLNSMGQISAVGTIISSGYGFISGAYMPISSFAPALRNIIAFLPGTYGTALVRTHSMRGALSAMQNEGIPTEAIEAYREALDCNIYFFDLKVEPPVMYIILILSIALLAGIYIMLNVFKKASK